MSMKTYYYLGPYIHYKSKRIDLDAIGLNRLRELRGELIGASDTDFFFGANVKVPEIERPLTLNLATQNILCEFTESTIHYEIADFEKCFEDEIRILMALAIKDGGWTSVEWGLVSGVF